jgi:hypothetical protein
VSEEQAEELVATVTTQTDPLALGRWVGDHAGIMLFGLVVFVVVLRFRLRRVDPLIKAHRRLTEEAARFEAAQGRTDAEQLVHLLPCPQGGLPLGYAPPQPWRPWRCRARPYRPVGLR